MSLADARMKAAVRVADRALRGADDTSVDERLLAFRSAYRAIADLDAGDPDWAEDTLWAAVSLVDDMYHHGGQIAEVVDALVRAHDVIVETVTPPAPRRPRRKRRDA